MSGAAQRDETRDEMQAMLYGGSGSRSASAAALKQMAAERLAAHRDRRAAVQAQETEMRAKAQQRREGMRTQSQLGASRVREAVAARYERSVSYREFLAAEAERALQQAQAEAEVAARKARAMAEAQMELIQELAQWNQPEPGPREQAIERQHAETRGELAHMLADIALGARELMAEPVVSEETRAGLKIQMFEELGAETRQVATQMRRDGARFHAEESAVELEELEEEIAFRLAPEFGEHRIETEAIPANIIEFPRQLVAPRKARPRLAEGPLREETKPEPQLRIFEVEAEQISVEPAALEATGAPEWQSLYLEAETEQRVVAPLTAQLQFALPPQTAAPARRVMAAAVDACCIGAAMVGFATVVVRLTGVGLRGVPFARLAGTAGVVLLAVYLLYEMLFFSLNVATPGMLYARIGLCTFGDDNPTRKAMRRRVGATLLAACPLGMGLVWMWMDADRLGWHDRMSRMYQRAY